MNQRDFITALAEETGFTKQEAIAFFDGFKRVVTATVKTGEPVMLTGFAKFARVDRPARTGRNPATGEAIKIKAKRAVRVTPLKAFKDEVMNGRGVKKK